MTEQQMCLKAPSGSSGHHFVPLKDTRRDTQTLVCRFCGRSLAEVQRG